MSILAIITLIFVVIFGIVMYNSSFNNKIVVQLSTFRVIRDREIFDKIDSSPFSISVAFIGYTQECTANDGVIVTFEGCRNPNGKSCNVILRYSKTVSKNIVVCNITTTIDYGTLLSSTSIYKLKFTNTSFHTSHIIYTVSTLNSKDTFIYGNSYFGGIIIPKGLFFHGF